MDVKDLNSSNGYPTSRDEDLGGAGSRSDMGGGLVLKPLQTVKQPAGGTETPQGLLASFGMWLLKQGRSEKTIKTYINYLKVLEEKGVDLADPEKIKEFLAKTDFSINTKNTIAAVYTAFLRFIGGSWDKPSFKPVEKIPFIPTEEELDQLIAGSGRKMAALLQSLKETGMRIGEALRLKWTDVDFERRVVSITPEKGSRARMLPISERLVEMFNSLPKKSERVFPTSDASVKLTFFRVRKKTAKKLGNPRLLKITFHTFRHWKATMEYHKTKDIIHVKELLGHRRIDNTMLYISIEKSLFQYKNDEFYCKTASTVEEASKLIEAGFDYVTTFNGVMMFRKRK
jgi:integrase/recombinase XerD